MKKIYIYLINKYLFKINYLINKYLLLNLSMENEDKESHTTLYKKYGIPGSIIILDKNYTFKTALANQKQFIYR